MDDFIGKADKQESFYPMGSKLRQRAIQAFLLFIVVIFIMGVFNTIWTFDSFQKTAFPKKYWTKKVAELESKVKADENLIEFLSISLIREDAKTSIERSAMVKQSTDWEKLYNVLDEAEKKGRMLEIKELELKIEILKKGSNENREQLKKAKQELLKYQ